MIISHRNFESFFRANDTTRNLCQEQSKSKAKYMRLDVSKGIVQCWGMHNKGRPVGQILAHAVLHVTQEQVNFDNFLEKRR